MKKVVQLFFVAGIFLGFVQTTEAAYLKFDKTSYAPAAGVTFTADVVVDAGTDQITSSDVWVIYDPLYIEAQSVAAGSLFPAVTNNITSGKVSITGLIVDPGTYKTGSGTIATITFRSLKNGSTNLTFDCRTDVSNSSKIIKNDVNATNVIVCSQNVPATISIGGVAAPTTPPSGGYVPVANPTTPAYLPETGIIENMMWFATPGLILLFIGTMLRLVL